MSQTIVIYCSKNGATRRAAQDIAGLLGADLAEIENAPNVSAYDLVVVGASISNVPASIAAHIFLERHKDELARVAFFGTCGNGDADTVLATWEKACQKKPIATITLPFEEIESGRVASGIYRFAEEINAKLEEADLPSANPNARGVGIENPRA